MKEMLLLKISGTSHLYPRLLNMCKAWHSLDLPLHLCFFHSPCQEFLNQRSISIYWSVNQTLRTKLNFIIFRNIFSLLPFKVAILFLCILFFGCTQWCYLLHYIWSVYTHPLLSQWCQLFLLKEIYKFSNRQLLDSDIKSNTIIPREPINM